VVSTALALALAEAGIVRRQLGRGGRDVTRLAASSPDVWTAIALENSEAIESAVEGIKRELDGFRESLQSADRESLKQRFLRARDWSGPVEH
jgi:prephenate dehydrogenase